MTTPHQSSDKDSLTISCSGPDEIVAAIDDAMPRLPKGVRRAFNRMKVQLLQQLGEEGLFERFNNRTVASLLDEFEAAGSIAPIERGELDGVTYDLYDTLRKDDEIP